MIRFSTAAASAVTMLDSSARDLLRMAGRLNTGTRGGIAADELAMVLQTLRSAIAAAQPATDAGAEPDNTDAAHEAVSLNQRAYPLLDLLERAAKKNTPVLWEQL